MEVEKWGRETWACLLSIPPHNAQGASRSLKNATQNLSQVKDFLLHWPVRSDCGGQVQLHRRTRRATCPTFTHFRDCQLNLLRNTMWLFYLSKYLRCLLLCLHCITFNFIEFRKNKRALGQPECRMHWNQALGGNRSPISFSKFHDPILFLHGAVHWSV